MKLIYVGTKKLFTYQYNSKEEMIKHRKDMVKAKFILESFNISILEATYSQLIK